MIKEFEVEPHSGDWR